jgi:hypothetical protein
MRKTERSSFFFLSNVLELQQHKGTESEYIEAFSRSATNITPRLVIGARIVLQKISF